MAAEARTPPVIRQLPDTVANQIAAGEVLERPAAAVKELVENSLDAGASRVVVRIEDGGRRLLEVVDDGHGMRPEDMVLALARHATSKLMRSDDLFRVATLGFRGEALPSIASVSEFTVASRPHDRPEGQELVVTAGQIGKGRPCAMPPGTRVTVRNLFWNTPVRLKFLKTAQAEAGAVSDTLARLALAHPEVAFALHQDGRTTLDLPPGQDLRRRAREVLGPALAEALLAVAHTTEVAQLHGFVAHPSHARPTTRRQYVILNGRPISDRLITAAIREGYQGFLEPRLHGVVVVHLDLDPGLVDVNVHPTKAEVRFRHAREVFGLVRHGIREALEAHAGGGRLVGSDSSNRTPATTMPEIVARTVVHPAIQERYLPPVPTTTTAVAESALGYAAQPGEAVVAGEPSLPDGDLADVRQVVQLGDAWVLVEERNGIRIIDQHALHEKALYLALDPGIADFTRAGVQELALPRVVELEPRELAAIEPHFPRLAAVGIRAEIFGPAQLALRAVPAMLSRLDWSGFFVELARASEAGESDPLERVREHILHRRACRAAIKAGQRLGHEEMLELVRLLRTVEGVDHCPHGRPTTLELSWQELDRRFQR